MEPAAARLIIQVHRERDHRDAGGDRQVGQAGGQFDQAIADTGQHRTMRLPRRYVVQGHHHAAFGQGEADRRVAPPV